MSRDDITLLDVARAARLALEFAQGMSKEAFERDVKTQSAVLHQVLIMGEAVKRLSKELRSANPQIPWILVAGMRDKLIHAYDEVDLDQVWTTLRRDLPELLRQLEALIGARDGG